MPAQEDSTGGPVPPESRTEDEQPVQWRLTFLVAIIAIGLIAIAFTAGFLALYMFLYQAVWSRTDFVAKNRWMIPAGVLVFSLLVGLCQKYLRAPNVIRGSFVDAMKEGKTEDYRTF
ncbi:MAG: chloride channel protein, partial [Methanomicrobiales archaeon]|nr:chloride channel protein [Methanomicrobiales archaeon]